MIYELVFRLQGKDYSLVHQSDSVLSTNQMDAIVEGYLIEFIETHHLPENTLFHDVALIESEDMGCVRNVVWGKETFSKA